MHKAFHEKMRRHYTVADRQQKVNYPTNYNIIQTSYLEGPHTILKNIPMPKVDTLHGYPWIPAKQIVNHLLALGVDTMLYRAGSKEDWVGADVKYACQYINTLYKKTKAGLKSDPALSK